MASKVQNLQLYDHITTRKHYRGIIQSILSRISLHSERRFLENYLPVRMQLMSPTSAEWINTKQKQSNQVALPEVAARSEKQKQIECKHRRSIRSQAIFNSPEPNWKFRDKLQTLISQISTSGFRNGKLLCRLWSESLKLEATERPSLPLVAISSLNSRRWKALPSGDATTTNCPRHLAA